jgi:proteasome lid subunit RPN8/RPN11
VRLSRQVLAAATAHATQARPWECCGVVIEDGGVQSAVRFPNVADDPRHHFRMPDADVVAMWRDIDRTGARLVAVYHSHVTTPPTPSRADLAYAVNVPAPMLIIGWSRGLPIYRAWYVQDGHAKQEWISVTEPRTPPG